MYVAGLKIITKHRHEGKENIAESLVGQHSDWEGGGGLNKKTYQYRSALYYSGGKTPVFTRFKNLGYVHCTTSNPVYILCDKKSWGMMYMHISLNTEKEGNTPHEKLV